jgi:hypothetical protein
MMANQTNHKWGKQNRSQLIAEVKHCVVQDAELRLSRAVDILLGSALREPEGSANVEKEKEPPKNSRPEEVAGKSDGEDG